MASPWDEFEPVAAKGLPRGQTLEASPWDEFERPASAQRAAAVPSRSGGVGLAVERGLEQLGTMGFAPEIRAQLFASTRYTPEEIAAKQARADALARSKTEVGAAGLVDPMRDTAAYQQELAREKALLSGLGEQHPIAYYTSQLLPLGSNLLRALGRPVARALGSAAERLAVRSAGADRTAFKRAFGRPANTERISEVGDFLLKEGVPLRSPSAMQEGLSEVLRETGPQIGELTKAATKTGTRVNLEHAALKAVNSPTMKALSGDTEGRPVVKRVTDFVTDKIAQLGPEISPEDAHAIRMRLDTLAKWDNTRPPEQIAAWRELRDAVSRELSETMEATNLGERWLAANSRYSLARRAKDLADIGVERRTGNFFASPTEKASLLLGGTTAALAHPSGLAIPVATFAAKRYGMPSAARAAQAGGAAGELMSRIPTTGALPAAMSGAALAQDPNLAEALARIAWEREQEGRR